MQILVLLFEIQILTVDWFCFFGFIFAYDVENIIICLFMENMALRRCWVNTHRKRNSEWLPDGLLACLWSGVGGGGCLLSSHTPGATTVCILCCKSPTSLFSFSSPLDGLVILPNHTVVMVLFHIKHLLDMNYNIYMVPCALNQVHHQQASPHLYFNTEMH